MRKKIFCVLFAAVLSATAGCATWKSMTSSEKARSVLTYYRAFSRGLSESLKIVATYFPDLAPMVSIGEKAVATLEEGVTVLASYIESKASEETISAQMSVVDGATKAANATVGEIVAASTATTAEKIAAIDPRKAQ